MAWVNFVTHALNVAKKNFLTTNDPPNEFLQITITTEPDLTKLIRYIKQLKDMRIQVCTIKGWVMRVIRGNCSGIYMEKKNNKKPQRLNINQLNKYKGIGHGSLFPIAFNL